MGITIETIEPDTALPASSDVVIIGGGIIGIMTGLFLARDGIYRRLYHMQFENQAPLP